MLNSLLGPVAASRFGPNARECDHLAFFELDGGILDHCALISVDQVSQTGLVPIVIGQCIDHT